MTNDQISPSNSNQQERSPEVVEAGKVQGNQDTGVVEASEEEKEIVKVKTRFQNAPKFKKWRELYFNKDSGTFGDATACAYIAYGLDKSKPGDRKYASDLGYRNTKKCESWAQDYLSELGYSPSRQLQILALKASSTNNARYLQMLMEVSGTYQPSPSTLVQNNNNTQINIKENEKEDFDAKFKEFLEKS